MKDLINVKARVIDDSLNIKYNYFDYSLMRVKNIECKINDKMSIKEMEDVFGIINSINIRNTNTDMNDFIINELLKYIKTLNKFDKVVLNKFRKNTSLKTMLIYINNEYLRSFIDDNLKNAEYEDKINHLDFDFNFSTKDIELLNKLLNLNMLNSSIATIYNSFLDYSDKKLLTNIIFYLEEYDNVFKLNKIYLDLYLNNLLSILEETEYTLNELLVENIKYKLLFEEFVDFSLFSSLHLKKHLNKREGYC